MSAWTAYILSGVVIACIGLFPILWDSKTK